MPENGEKIDRPFEAIVGRGNYGGMLTKAKKGTFGKLGAKTRNYFTLDFDKREFLFSKASDRNQISESYKFTDIRDCSLENQAWFVLTMQDRTYHLQADDVQKASQWVAVLESAKEWATKPEAQSGAADHLAAAAPPLYDEEAVSWSSGADPSKDFGAPSTASAPASKVGGDATKLETSPTDGRTVKVTGESNVSVAPSEKKHDHWQPLDIQGEAQQGTPFTELSNCADRCASSCVVS